MPVLFDVSKEIILVTGASQGAGAAVRAGVVRPWRRDITGSVVTVDGGFLLT